MAIRLDITDMQAIASLMGGRCLSKEYWDAETPLSWRCENGHNWDAPYENVRHGGWCLQCYIAEQKQIYLEQMQEIAVKNGGLCLSPVYNGVLVKLKFQCTNGHQFMKLPYEIKRNKWCTECKEEERELKRLTKVRRIAEKKGGQLLSEKYSYHQEKLLWRCKKGHEWKTIAKVVLRGGWCPVCYGKIKYTIEDLQKKAKEHDGKCLSKKYINSREKVKWECKLGHRWATTAAIIFGGHWCPKCRVLNMDFHRGTLEEYKKIARAHKGKLLSTTYTNANNYLKWQCSRGHIWEARAVQVKHRHSWCPECYNIKRKNFSHKI